MTIAHILRRKFLGKLRQFLRKFSDEIAARNNRLVRNFYWKGPIFGICLIAALAMTYLNTKVYGAAAFPYYIPTIAILIGLRLAYTLGFATRYADRLFDLAPLSMFLGANFLLIELSNLGFDDRMFKNLPILSVLFFFCILNASLQIRYIVAKILTVGMIQIGFIVIYHRDQIDLVLTQVLLGIVFGCILLTLIVIGKILFFYASIAFSKDITHAYEEMEKLLFEHQVQRIRTGETLEQTMPEDTRNAVVVCFDLIDSSRLGSTVLNHFMEAFSKAISPWFSKKGLNETEQTKAYLIKAVGDGFIASFGYPFPCYPQTPEHLGVNFCFEILKVFQRVAASEQFRSYSIHCSIAACYGEVTPHFTFYDRLLYDLYGDGIVKAMRHESLRKALFKPGQLTGSIITVDPKVFANSLTSEHRSKLGPVHLKEHKVTLRGYPEQDEVFVYLETPEDWQYLDASKPHLKAI